jgi:hypothetical protein
LIDKYKTAAATSICAESYYQNLVETINVADILNWEQEIKKAEEERMYDRSVMDIIGARDTKNVPAAAQIDDCDCPDSNSDWIQLAINIEEKQCV